MSATPWPLICTPTQAAPAHETREGRRAYADDARSAGITEAVELIVCNRPAAALRRVTRIVEEELAIEGFAGIRINIAEQMTRLVARKRCTEAGAR